MDPSRESEASGWQAKQLHLNADPHIQSHQWASQSSVRWPATIGWTKGTLWRLTITTFHDMTPKNTTTKLSLVFYASAKTRKKNQSLSESSHGDPVLLKDLCGLLLRVRLHKVALVEKAFLQGGPQPDDRDVTRFLRSKDPSKPSLLLMSRIERKHWLISTSYFVELFHIWQNCECFGDFLPVRTLCDAYHKEFESY